MQINCDIQNDIGDIAHDFGLDVGVFDSERKHMEPVEHKEEVFEPSVDSFCSRKAFVRYLDHTEDLGVIMESQVVSSQDVLFDKIVDSEADSGKCRLPDVFPVTRGQKDFLFEDGLGSVASEGDVDFKVSSLMKSSVCREKSGEKNFFKRFREGNIEDEMDLLHWTDFHRKKVRGAGESFLSKMYEQAVLERCEKHRIQQLLNDPDIRFLVSSLRCEDCAHADIIRKQLTVLADFEKDRSMRVSTNS